MKTAYKLMAISALLAIIIISCQKEKSYEAGVKSDGVLLSDITGVCTDIIVNGTYKKDSSLNSSHYVEVSVVVNSAGNYLINTDTVNGYYFSATGTFTSAGTQVVRLQGIGKPLTTGINDFTVLYDSTYCEFSVTVIPGSGGTSVYTFVGSPGSCAGATVNGTYAVGLPLSSSNTVVLNVNVTTAGTWSLSTNTVNGMVFSGSGTFSATGGQTITLLASGTPAAEGTFNIPVTIGTNTCTFAVVCTNADYFPRTIGSNWSYEFDGDPNDSTLVVVIPQTYTTSGKTYNIFLYTYDANQGFDTSGYYRRAGADYLQWINMGDYLSFDNSFWLEYIFLKDNLAVNQTWTSVQFSGPVTDNGVTTTVTARFKYKILQKNVSVTVKGVPFPNTITVEEKLEIYDGTNWNDVSAFTGYYVSNYSLGVGLIKQDFHESTGLVYPLDLRRYQVN